MLEDTLAGKSVRRKRRPPVVGCLAVLAAAVVLSVGWYAVGLRPVSADTRPRGFVVRRGERASSIGRRLAAAGLVRNATVFYLYTSFGGHASQLRSGRYRLSPSLGVAGCVEVLRRGGAADTGTATIPEGRTVAQMADALLRAGTIDDRDQFVRLARKPAGVTVPSGMPRTGLEGYLFPETYEFGEHARPERVMQQMVDTFEARFAQPYAAEIARSGHTLHQIVTIASLIEREAEVDRDRARIAGVIENRLKRKMRLQIDATVLYALGYHKTRVMYRDLETRSPYNTYRRAGLPPGPIASPGLPSLLAALRPERHDYLYYVAAPGGAHIFTRTEAEHNRAVAQVRALRKAPREVRGDDLR